MAVLDDDCSIALKSHPTTWVETGEQFRDGRAIINFDDEWRPLFRHGPTGVEVYPVLEATRKFIRGCFSEPTGFKGGALDALVDVLPQGDVHLFVRGVGFIGRFSAVEDAQMIAGALKADRPIIFGSSEEIMAMPEPDVVEIITALDPEFVWPKKFTINHAQGVYEMAKKATKKKAAKVAKAEAAQRRADGPVAKAREQFEKIHKANPEATSDVYIKACEDAGVNRGTATTQLGRWRKEKGIAVKRGGARKKAEKSAAKTDKPATKKGGKKKSAKKKEPAAPKPGLPKSEKGAKRHKPGAATPGKSSGTTQAPAPSDKPTETKPSPQTASVASAPATSPATASGAQGTAAGASSSPAASSPKPAGGEAK